MEPEAPEDIPLPPLQMADLDDATLRALFTDVELLGQEVEVTLKHGAEVHVSPGAESHASALGAALRALQQGEVLGVQLRYRHQGAAYLDTLMRTRTAYRLVRIQPL